MAKNVGSKNLWWKMFVCIMLAFMLSLTLFVAACGKKDDDDDDDDTNTEVTTPTDDQIIANGNFEIVSSDATYPIATPTSWSKSYATTTNKSGTNPTSTYSSGVIDTSKIDEHKFTGSNADEQLEALKKVGITTHFTDDEIDTYGTNLLMLANKYSGNTGVGTVQKATSTSTLTISSGTAIKICVWVRTNGFFNTDDEADKTLKNHNNKNVNGEAGAYIGLVNTVNSANVAPFQIKNINTNGEWQQYSMLIQGSDYTTSKVKLVLGLGYGDSTNVEEYVEGYAFFDDITYEVMPATSTTTDSTLIPYDHSSYSSLNECNILDDNDEVKTSYERIVADASGSDLVNLSTTSVPDYAVKLNFAMGVIESNLFDSGTTSYSSHSIGLSTDENATAPSSAVNENESKIYTKADLKANSDFTDFMAKYPFSSTNILLLRAKVPSAYTATFTNNGNSFEVAPNIHYTLSFWVKTSEIDSGSGAGITIIDKGNNQIAESEYLETSFSAIDTTTIKADPDYYDGWTKYSFYIYNGSTEEYSRFFDFKLTFGLTTQSTNPLSYNSGYAAFTNFVYEEVSESIFDSVTDGTYLKKVSLNAGFSKSNTGIDTISPGDTYNADGTDKIKTQPVDPANYYGVTGGTSLTGTKDANGNYIYPESTKNTDVVTGLINYKYMNDYSGLGLTELGGASIQPLIIKNNAATSYGYIGKAAKTLAANTLTELSVRVKVLGDAKAYIYLTSSLTDDDYKILTFDRPAVGDYTTASKLLYQTVTKTSANTDDDGWVYVTFYVKTGDTAVSYNLELWNGARNGKDNCTGTVLYDMLNIETITDTTNYDFFLDKVNTEDVNNDNFLKFTQQPTDSEDETKYEELVVYAKDTENLRVFANYSTIDIAEEEEEEKEEEEEETTTTETDPNVWLMISSLIIALALIVTLVLVVIKKSKSKIEKKKVYLTTRYKGKKKHYTSNNDELDINEDDDREDSLDATDDSDDDENIDTETDNEDDNK
jgi:hypothetical protein